MIVIHLATKRTLSKKYIDDVSDLVRSIVDDPDLEVLVIGVRWSDEGDK
jgi:hypothetical protein